MGVRGNRAGGLSVRCIEDKDTINSKPPVANAGADQTVEEGTTITLDGSNSSDVDGKIVSYKWMIGSTVISDKSKFTATPRAGTYKLTLLVTDNDGLTGTDTVKITVNKKHSNNNFPVARAGSDKTVTEGTSVTLDGSKSYVNGSYDSDGDTLSYTWMINGKIVSNSKIYHTGKLPIGVYTYTLKVTDGHGLSDTDTVKITVKKHSNNSCPVAKAGADKTVKEGTYVTLDGSSSYDADGYIKSYRWTYSGGKYAGNSSKITLKASNAGNYIFTLMVTDNDGLTDTDTVKVYVYSPKPVIESLDPISPTVGDWGYSKISWIWLKGKNFKEGLSVKLCDNGTGSCTTLYDRNSLEGYEGKPHVDCQSSNEIEMTFYNGLKLSSYSIQVINPDGKQSNIKRFNTSWDESYKQ